MSKLENDSLGREQKIISLLRIIFVVVVLAVIAILVVLYAPDLIKLLKDGNMEEMREYISGAGNEGILIIVGLQFLQTITIFFPGIPIYMCSGIVYGKLKGTIICYLTYVISNVIIYLLSKRMKESADVLFNNQNESKIAELVKRTKRPAVLITVLCVVPIIPNGIIPHIAANSSLSLKQFFKAVAIGCIPGIFLFVWCGELLLTKYFWLVILLMVLAVILLLVGVKYKTRLMGWIEKKFDRSSNK